MAARTWRNSLLLTLTALIWGVAFVAQSEGSAYMGSSTFTGLRFLMAAAALYPFIYIADRRRKAAGTPGQAGGDAVPGADRRVMPGSDRASLWRAGFILGALLCVASLLQQEGIAQGASAGKAGFVTATYIVLVPILNLLIFRKKTNPLIWIGVAVALAGLYLLCIDKESLSLQLSDLLLILCALGYSFQILAIDRFSPRFDALKLSAIQFLSCGVLASIVMVFTDIRPVGLAAWGAAFTSWNAWIPLLYAAILSSAVGYTLQIIAQKGLNPTVASLLMSLESVFAALAGWFILRQSLTPRELLGCALVFAAVLLAQLAPTQDRRQNPSFREVSESITT